MPTNLGTAYVSVMPSMKGFAPTLEKGLGGPGAGKTGEKAGRTLGKSFLGGFRGAAAGITTVVASLGIGRAFVNMGKQALSSYSSYEQLVGGVDTLYKGASKRVQKYAAQAYKTVGMSANDYMATATSFAATLRQSLGGDVAKAAEKSNTALVDMADNANKMGTDMGMIQNAYQGFAKQNYTMLDNLKLGYGGTKAEMERLLKDAQALTGQKYDISQFDDVIDAIHAVQQNLDITGTTSKEAATTVEGSVNSMRAAWSNWLTELMKPEGADVDRATDELVESVGTVVGNVAPKLGQFASVVGPALGKAASGIAPYIPQIVTPIAQGFVTGLQAVLTSLMPDTDWGSVLASVGSAAQSLGTVLSSIPWETIASGISGAFGFVAAHPELGGLLAAIGVGLGIIKAASAVGPLLETLGTGLGKVGEAAPAASGGLRGIAQAALGIVAVGAGIMLAGAGIRLISDAAVQLATAGPGAQVAFALIAGGIVAIGVAVGVAAPSLTAGAAGLLAFGAAALEIGAAIAVASLGITALVAALGAASGGISQIVSAIGDAVSGVVGSIGNAISGVLDSLAGVFESIGASALNAGRGFEMLSAGVERLTRLNLADLGATMVAVSGGVAAVVAAAGGAPQAGQGMMLLASALRLVTAYGPPAADTAAKLSAAMPPIAKSAPPAAKGLAALSSSASRASGGLGRAASSLAAGARGARTLASAGRTGAGAMRSLASSSTAAAGSVGAMSSSASASLSGVGASAVAAGAKASSAMRTMAASVRGSIDKIPKKTEPKIKVKADTGGASKAKKAIDGVKNKTVWITVRKRGSAKVAGHAAGAVIPRFASGAVLAGGLAGLPSGIFTGPTLTEFGWVGERGDEAWLRTNAGGAIVPLSNRRKVHPFASAVAAEMGGTGGGGVSVGTVVVNTRATDADAIAAEIAAALDRQLSMVG